MGFRVVIPARFDSSRLPGKALLPLAGKPMLQWVHDSRSRRGPLRGRRAVMLPASGQLKLKALPACTSAAGVVREPRSCSVLRATCRDVST